MRTATAVLSLLLVSSSPFAGTKAPAPEARNECANHAVNGYTLGMSHADALAVRGGTLRSNGTVSVGGGESEATLEFDTAGKLLEVDRVEESGDPAAVRDELIRMLGEPTKDYYQELASPGGQPRIVRTVWMDSACRQVIDLTLTYKTTTTRTVVRVTAEK